MYVHVYTTYSNVPSKHPLPIIGVPMVRMYYTYKWLLRVHVTAYLRL